MHLIHHIRGANYGRGGLKNFGCYLSNNNFKKIANGKRYLQEGIPFFFLVLMFHNHSSNVIKLSKMHVEFCKQRVPKFSHGHLWCNRHFCQKNTTESLI